MIVFDLECRDGKHRFEGWFGSSDDFARQREGGFIACPTCGSVEVVKALMAPAVARKGNQLPAVAPAAPQPQGKARPMARAPLPAEAVQMMQALAVMQTKALESSRWVGDNFAEDARAMHYGEREAQSIHGQTTLAEAQALLEEGIEVAPLPFPVAPPGEAN